MIVKTSPINHLQLSIQEDGQTINNVINERKVDAVCQYLHPILSFVREIYIFLCLWKYKSENTAAELNYYDWGGQPLQLLMLVESATVVEWKS